MHEKILIVDFGSQVTQLIARRVREEKVYSEIVPYQKAEAAFREMKPKAVILSGGPASVLDKDAPLAPKAIYDSGVPVLGICYGEQAMAAQSAAGLRYYREFGCAESRLSTKCRCSKRGARVKISRVDEPRRPGDKIAERLCPRHVTDTNRHHWRRCA